MLSALAAADTVTWVSICVKALVYVTTLVAAGSALSLVTLRTLPQSEGVTLKRLAVVCAAASAILSLARLPLRASFLTGGTWQSATDTIMLTMVAESPLGASITLRLVGLGLICAILIPGRSGRWLAVLGAVIVAASFAFRGHALGEPRFLLGLLITLHILALAFWIGAFTPLYRNAGEETGSTAHEFGRKALWVVGALTFAGAGTLWILTGGVVEALFTPYAQFFAIKLFLFLAVMGFAAWNKLRLTPALLRAERDACAKLRQSIRLESALIGAVLITTAAMTTLSAPVAFDQSANADDGAHLTARSSVKITPTSSGPSSTALA